MNESKTPASSRRRVVMSRSVRLGHCVCDVQKPCPCDTFRAHNVCLCAGEKLPARDPQAVRLTRHVRRAGCASKISQADLLQILGHLPPVRDPRVLLGAAAGDDAGVYQLDAHTALVQTVDVFTPCVDDPGLFGQIAAANSVSDVYAMGGKPLTALSIVGFPIETLAGALLETMLAGGMEKLEEAGCSLLGGHSINDEEIKMGFAVTGLIHPAQIKARAAAQAGDALVLTKPLGTGLVSFAAQVGTVNPECLAYVGRMMATLNKDAAELMNAHDAHAATDVTGFGLAGHLVEMAKGAGLAARISLARLPVLRAVGQCLREEVISGAVERNQEYAMGWVRVADEAHPENLPILFDPQTSGGLLVALPAARADEYVAAMRARGHDATATIGCFEKPEPGTQPGVIVEDAALASFYGPELSFLLRAGATG